MTHINVIIIHRDDKNNLEKCLKSVKDAGDEFYLVDLVNSQKASELSHLNKIKYLKNELSDIYAVLDKKNDKGYDEYVFIIGSNEYLSGGLKNHMAILKSALNYDAYKFSILKYYYGKWMKHSGLYPCEETRLFKKNKAIWTGDTINLSHENEKDLTIGEFRGEIYDMVYSSIYDHINQMNIATEKEAKVLFQSGMKSSSLKIIFRPWVHFMRLFFIKFGFLDGFYGLINAVISGYCDFLLQVKLKFLWRIEAEK